MNLRDYLLKQTHTWSAVFAQERTRLRAVAVAVGLLCGMGRRTVTRAIGFHGNTQKDWSADYKVFSRSPWTPRALFHPILESALQAQPMDRIVISTDDTRVWRNGKHVPQTQWHRDPMGPPFQTNLRWGHRFLQASLVLPLYQQDGESAARSIPVRFEIAPVVKKPGKKATKKQRQRYRQQKKKQNLSVQFVTLTHEVRQQLNETGHQHQRLIQVGDGSFCNRTVFRPDWEAQNVTIIARCRKDIVLCRRATGPGPRFYDPVKFTPEQVRRDGRRGRWQTTQIFHGGCYREVRYKEKAPIYWQGGAGQRPVRLLVVAPVGYRTSKNGRKYYRKPAYLLTTDLTTAAPVILQAYFDRWGIEVNHRDEKETLGVGQAQVWNPRSVTKVPALLVAMYSWLLLASLHCYGPTRTEVYEPLPKWRRGAKRPSCLDLVTLLRRQLADKPSPFATGTEAPSYTTMVTAAAA